MLLRHGETERRTSGYPASTRSYEDDWKAPTARFGSD